MVELGILCRPRADIGRLAYYGSEPIRRYLTVVVFLLLANAPQAAGAQRLPVKTYTSADGLAQDRVVCAVRDSRGFMWFCTSDGLSRFDGSRFTTYRAIDGLPISVINDIEESHDGRYWIATNGGGVCRFDPVATRPSCEVLKAGDTITTNRVNTLYEDPVGRLWAGTDGGLFRFEPAEASRGLQPVPLRIPGRPDQVMKVWSILGDARGVIWIGTGFGVVRVLPGGRTVHAAVNPMGDTDRVNDLLIDGQQRLWIAHETGTAVLDRMPGSDQDPLEGLRWPLGQKSEPRDLHASADGAVWIVTLGGELWEHRTGFTRYTAASGLPDAAFRSIGEDADGDLWIGMAIGGVSELKLRGFQSYDRAGQSAIGRVNTIFETRSGQVCATGGSMSAPLLPLVLNCFDGAGFSAIPLRTPAADVPPLWPGRQHVLQDHTGAWWVPTPAGLYRFANAARVEDLANAAPQTVYTTREGLSGNDIVKLYEDSRGDLWISTLQADKPGLTRWLRSTGQFEQYDDRNGLPPLAQAVAFNEDRSGSVWIGLYGGGLARYRDGVFTVLGNADGLPESDITDLYVDRRGRLLIGTTTQGIAMIERPDQERPQVIAMGHEESATTTSLAFAEAQDGRLYVGTSQGLVTLDAEGGAIGRYTTADGLIASEVRAVLVDRHGTVWAGTPRGISRLALPARGPQPPPPVFISALRLGDVSQPVPILGTPSLGGFEIAPGQNTVQIDYGAIGEGMRYRHRLEGAADAWSAPTELRSVTYPKLAPGSYRFQVVAVGSDGVDGDRPATVAFTVLAPIWQRWWFVALAAVALVAITLAVYRFRIGRLLELERIRTRIATDLHDDIGANLTKIALLTEVAHREVEHQRLPSPEQLGTVSAVARESLDAMSDIVWSVDPGHDRLHDLVQRIRHSASDVLTAAGITLVFHAPAGEQDPGLDASLRRDVFLIVKECLTNIVRHSGATRVEIDVTIARGRLRLTIADDGRGFDENVPPQGHGLINMRRRARALGGTIEVATSGRGTTVTLQAPIGRPSWRDGVLLRRVLKADPT